MRVLSRGTVISSYQWHHHGMLATSLPTVVGVRSGPRYRTGWRVMCRLNEIRPGHARLVLFNGVEIALCRDEDTVFAVGARCPRHQAPLSDGHVVAGRIICPLHGCDFDLHSGVNPHDTTRAIPVYQVQVYEGDVELDASSVPAGPGVPDTYLGRWARHSDLEPEVAAVHALAEGQTIQPAPRQRTAEPNFDNVSFLPAELSKPRSTGIDTSTTIGPDAQKPLRTEIPIIVGHISYGSVSIETKVALARGARQAGTAIGSGDGGSHGRERDAASRYLVQVLPGQLPNPEVLSEADAIEIRLGEAGRPGRGVHLPAQKVSTEISLHREIPPSADWCTELAALDSEHLSEQVNALREAGGGVPIGVKFAAGSLADDVALAVKSGVDFLTVEGSDAGASSGQGSHLAAHTGLDSLSALCRTRKLLDQLGSSASLLIAGGFHRADQIAKALALGADAVVLGRAALWAIGCQNFQACDGGACPVGIATQDPTLRLRLNPDISARRLSSYLGRLSDGVTEYCHLIGGDTVRALRDAQLTARDWSTAELTGLRIDR